MITVHGKFGIYATILADSISKAGVRMLTFEIAYPRIILAELNTHRALSKNSASSRAIPFAKMATQLTGRPVSFGANQGGMQAGAVLTSMVYNDGSGNWVSPEDAWEGAKESALTYSRRYSEAGYHKQIFNRLTEPFQMMKTVISGTEWSNFFWLRDDGMADPTLAELARCMREAKDAHTPTLLRDGEWHLPYVDYYQEVIDYTDDDVSILGPQVFYIPGEVDQAMTELTLEQAIKVSCARCAAVSYRNEGYGLDKSLELYERLVGSEKKHASALEHCATPMAEMQYKTSSVVLNIPTVTATWQAGISHADRNGKLWSGNLKGFIQYRKLIPGENYED